MARRAAPHRGIDVHYGDAEEPVADDAGSNRPSKTLAKQKSHSLQELGEALAELSSDALKGIEMPEVLRDAIEQYRRTKSHEGRRRQMQYVGKLMHRADEDLLREAVAAATLGTAQNALALHEAESWRAELIASDDAMTRWLNEHPETNTQELRSLVRQARKDAAGLTPEARQPKSFRDLFQYIKPMLSA
jgi:ribosome-associated protein